MIIPPQVFVIMASVGTCITGYLQDLSALDRCCQNTDVSFSGCISACNSCYVILCLPFSSQAAEAPAILRPAARSIKLLLTSVYHDGNWKWYLLQPEWLPFESSRHIMPGTMSIFAGTSAIYPMATRYSSHGQPQSGFAWLPNDQADNFSCTAVFPLYGIAL